MAEKSLLDYVLTGSSIVVTAAVAAAGFLLSARTESAKEQADNFDAGNKQYALITDFIQKCTSGKEEDRSYVYFLANKNYDLSQAHPAFATNAQFKSAFQQAQSACFSWLQASAGVSPTNIERIASAVQTDGALDAVKLKALVGKASSTNASAFGERMVGALESATNNDALRALLMANPQAASALATAASASGSWNTQVATNTVPVDPAATAGKWIYLGTYSNGRWITKYLTELDGWDPSQHRTAQASPQQFTVNYQTGAVNVRSGTFYPNAAFPPVTKSLPAGAKVQVLRAWPWFASNNWWAEIR